MSYVTEDRNWKKDFLKNYTFFFRYNEVVFQATEVKFIKIYQNELIFFENLQIQVISPMESGCHPCPLSNF